MKRKRSNRTHSSLLDPDESLSDYDISSDSDLSDSSALIMDDKDIKESGTIYEIQELISAIKISLDNLFKASVFIRKLAPKEKRKKASNTAQYDNREDIMYIKDRYPYIAKNNDALAMRLGEINARRRQYFKYRRDHHERLSTVNMEMREPRSRVNADVQPLATTKKSKSILSANTKPSQLAETEATEPILNPESEKELAALWSNEPAESVYSFATSIATGDDDALSFPPLLPDAADNSIFLCPYCWTMVELKSKNKEHQWQ